MRNKKLFKIFLFLWVGGLILSGCGTAEDDPNDAEGKVNVVASFYPIYDFAKKIGGEHVEVINLVPAGVEPHDWTPKSQDVANIVESDLFIYNGAGFEGWIDDVLSGVEFDDNHVVLEASKGIDLIKADVHEEETGHGEEHHEEEGHEDEESHEQENNADHEEEHGHHHGEYDPHVWLSPIRAKQMAENIKDALIQVDAAHQSVYEANYEQLIKQLNELDAELKEIVDNAHRKDMVVSHHAYGYLAADYGLHQLAVMGLSPDAEPTAQDIKDISEFIKEHDVQYILMEELVSPKLAETIANDLHIDTLVFNPLEGLTEEQLKDGEDYFSLMKENLKSLAKALQSN